MGRRVALTALMTDPGVEAAGEAVLASDGLDPAAGKTGHPGPVAPVSTELPSSQPSSRQPNPVQPSVQSAVATTQPRPQQPSVQQPSGQQPSVQMPDAHRADSQQASAQQPNSQIPELGARPTVRKPSTRSAHSDAAPPTISIPASVVRAPGANSVRSVARARVSDRSGGAQATAARPTSDRTNTEGPTVDLTSRAPASPQPGSDDAGEDELLFSDLERKEARLRWDQIEDLSRLAKRLNRARRGQPGRRITENTLIRVALDFLLENQYQLAGRTEAELLAELRDAR